MAGCGGGTKPGPPLIPGHINLTPSVNTSIVLGSTLSFVGSVQTASGTILNTPISYASSDTSILNLAPNGVACAGHWDVAFTTCTPGNVGVVTVTASALGASSVPTYVFVHPPIDNITVTGVLLNGVPAQEPCLSQSQSMTIEAHAFSQGNDVTASVGPFTWTAASPTVVNLIPKVNTAYNFATNQATATAVNPGITQVYASASGVSSTSFQQAQYTNAQNQASPVLDFFATCPIQNISLELGAAGSGQTSFVTAKGSAPTIVATLTDVMGNSSLPNTNGGVVLSKIPLTWTSSQPAVFSVSTGCTQSCTATTGSPGSVTVTASCSPPTCNIGFPQIPSSLSTPAQITACTQFFQAQHPQFAGCQALIPVPVYASPVFVTPPSSVIPLTPDPGISGVVTGATSSASVLAGSTGCAHEPPAACTTSAYFLSTSKASSGAQSPLPVSPNSFLFDLSGGKVFMGSDFGAEIVNPSNFGTSNNPFTSLGTVTGRVMAVSNNGNLAVFADTIHTPNQVYVVNATNATSPAATALNISSATAAAFSPDGLKTFIAGGTSGTSLYIFSSLQALQGPIALTGPANAIAFSPSSAFAFVAEGGSSPNLTAFATCNNQVAASVSLPASPLLMKVLPNVHIDGRDSNGNPIPDGIHVALLDSTGFDIVTWTVSPAAAGTLCPQGLTFTSGNPLGTVQRVELGQGTIQPVNFFATPDASQLYVVNASSSTVAAYNFIAGAVVGGIELLNAAPLSADMTTDAGTILVSGTDSMLHELSTSAGADLVQLPFPNLPDYLNPFCTIYPSSGACTLNMALAKP
jgi:hypothetical protein